MVIVLQLVTPLVLPMAPAQHLLPVSAVQGGVGPGARREGVQVVGGGRGVLRSVTVRMVERVTQ